MYNNPNEYFGQQNIPMTMAPMDNMQDMGYQMPYETNVQQPLYGQMPAMPMMPTMPMQQVPTMPMMPMQQMQPMQPIMPMGTTAGVSGGVLFPGTTSGTMPTTFGSVPLATDQFGGTPVTDTEYTQGYLQTQIGARIKIEFLIGTNMLVDREGTLTDVGISYIIIQEVETDDLLLCDIYSIKFVRFYR